MGDGIGDFAFWLAVGLLFLGMTLGPIGKGIARLMEVEERLDFAERLLTSGWEALRPEADTPPEPVDAVG